MPAPKYAFECTDEYCDNREYPDKMYPPGLQCDICDRGTMKRVSVPQYLKDMNKD